MQANNSNTPVTPTSTTPSPSTVHPAAIPSTVSANNNNHDHPHRSPSSSVFFCFGGSSHDSLDTPNKILLDQPAPTVADLAVALKKLFKIPDRLNLRVGNNIFNDDSLIPVPINDRNNVVLVKTIDPPHSAPAQDIEVWLQKEGLDTETVRLFKEHKVSPEILRTMKDEHLVKLGINNWSIRQQILDAIKKYEVQPLPRAPAIPLAHDIISIANVVSEITEQEGNKRKRESTEPTDPNAKESPAGGKRAKVGRVKRLKTKIKFKDIDALVNNERMPVNVGMSVYCGSIAQNSGCNGVGTIVQHKDKAVIQYTVNDETRYGSIAKFYKDVTGEALQEKGTSWGNFFFKNNANGQTYSLEGLKYLCVGPKKSVSAFLYFSNEARIKYKELKPDAFARLAGELWKKLTHEEKQPYRVLEEQDKERFNRERLEWESMVEKHAQPQVHIPLPIPSLLHQQIEQAVPPQQQVVPVPSAITEVPPTTTTTTTTPSVPPPQTTVPAENV